MCGWVSVAAANSLDGPGKGEGPRALLFENPVWGSFTGFSIVYALCVGTDWKFVLGRFVFLIKQKNLFRYF